jgi:hypothetical protein
MRKFKSRQNKVPKEFENFYKPLLLLKQILQSWSELIDEKHNLDAVSGLMVVHYSTFFMRILCNEHEVNSGRCLHVRNIVEDVLSGDQYLLKESEISAIVSFIDLIAKVINTTAMVNLHVILYSGYLDYQIYAQFNQDKPLFDYKYMCDMSAEVVERMREYSNAAQAILDVHEQSRVTS